MEVYQLCHSRRSRAAHPADEIRRLQKPAADHHRFCLWKLLFQITDVFKATIKTPLYLSVSEDRKCASTACPLVFLHFSHDTDMGEVDVDLLLRMSFVPFTALMDNNLGYKGVQDLGRQFCNPGVLFG